MAKSSSQTVRFEFISLTQRDVQRLVRENSLVIHNGEALFVLKDTPFIGRAITDENGVIRVNKDRKPIMALYTIAVVRHTDGTFTAGKVTLSYLAGEDLLEEATCPLLPCQDGIRKYAAVWQCSKIATRNFSLCLAAGDKVMPYDLVTVAGEPVEGYKEPSLTDVWMETSLADGTKKWVNKPDLGDEIELKRTRRASLQISSDTLSATERKVCDKLIKEALDYLRVVENIK